MSIKNYNPNFYLPPNDESWSDFISILYDKKCPSITFQVTENCNMACTYCYQHNKSNNKMTWEVAKIFIDKLLNDEFPEYQKNDLSGIIFEFFGGEPLLEIELITLITEYTINKMIELKHPWLINFRISICSNGLANKNKKFQEYLKKFRYFLSLGVTLDGCQELHDACRFDLQGNGTYDRIVEFVRYYKENYSTQLRTKMTLSPSNINYLYNAIINLIEEKYTVIHCNCIFEKGWEISHAKILYNELKRVADYLIDNNLYNKINVSLFNENWYKAVSELDNNNWCGGVLSGEHWGAAIDYKGIMYPCIRYMASSLNNRQKPLNIGTINNGYGFTPLERENMDLLSNITRRSQSTDECFYCPIATGCSWCSGYNYEEFGTPNKRATYICVMHQAQSLANVYYWNKLYKKLNIDKVFKMNLPKEKALIIISENEYNHLFNLTNHKE